MDERPRLKLVTKQPPKKVPANAKPIKEAVDEILADAIGGVRQSPRKEQLAGEIMASIDRLERMMLNFTKNLNDLGSSIDYTEARLNRVVRLTKTLATIAGIPE